MCRLEFLVVVDVVVIVVIMIHGYEWYGIGKRNERALRVVAPLSDRRVRGIEILPGYRHENPVKPGVVGFAPLLRGIEDRLVWEPNVHGVFSVSELSSVMHSFDLSSDLIGAFRVWDVGVPPKIQCFLWFVLLGRLPNLAMLSDCGIDIGRVSLACVFCGQGRDEIEHIFYSCRLAGMVWDFFFSWWHVLVVLPSCFMDFIFQGVDSFFSGYLRHWWLIGCVAVLWSLWLARNEAIFNSKVVSFSEICFLLKFCAFHWWWACPLDCSFPSPARVGCVGVEWIPPVRGARKFNVDGSARGKPGPAGCGGVLRDASGCILALFSGPLGIVDSNMEELHAIVAALEMLISMPRGAVLSLLVEFDSAVAISWVSHRERRPWRLGLLFHRLDSACLSLPCVCFSHVLREANGIADSLAKAGVDRSVWYCVSNVV
ncbi:hypothetical protein GQ457_14G017520 [Hibiscus cannabinus]